MTWSPKRNNKNNQRATCAPSIYLRTIHASRSRHRHGNKSPISRNKIKYIGSERRNKPNRVTEFGIESRNWFYHGLTKRHLAKGPLREKLGIGDRTCYCCNEKKKLFTTKITEVQVQHLDKLNFHRKNRSEQSYDRVQHNHETSIFYRRREGYLRASSVKRNTQSPSTTLF